MSHCRAFPRAVSYGNMRRSSAAELGPVCLFCWSSRAWPWATRKELRAADRWNDSGLGCGAVTGLTVSRLAVPWGCRDDCKFPALPHPTRWTGCGFWWHPVCAASSCADGGSVSAALATGGISYGVCPAALWAHIKRYCKGHSHKTPFCGLKTQDADQWKEKKCKI